MDSIGVWLISRREDSNVIEMDVCQTFHKDMEHRTVLKSDITDNEIINMAHFE